MRPLGRGGWIRINTRFSVLRCAGEPETEAWLDRLGPMEGWRCLDLGCGAMGMLIPPRPRSLATSRPRVRTHSNRALAEADQRTRGEGIGEG
jgi:hypothetical protein